MTQEFVTLPCEVVEQALEALKNCTSEYGHRCSRCDSEVDPGEKVASALRAALEQPQNHVPDAGNMVPAGWKLVPVEPTEKMVDMGRGLSSFPNGVYRAMLSAAPQPPTVNESLTTQPQGEQEPVAWVWFDANEKPCSVTFGGPNINTPKDWGVSPLYTHQQIRREPLTDERIDAIADAMPGGLEGFMNGWGWRQFARAVLEATHNIK